ncbi:MAG: LacI family DNA-binding transcriptional regulator [Burkholderiales bacterium]|nr:LacI family DNA-binding transcriptional regulator [Burkholderiales bacterium]
MKDVARIAGVAIVTVSRVLNEPDKVAPATREAVLDAMRQVGYLPNLVAGSLASNKSGMVAVVVPTITNSIFADTVQGAADLLEAEGISILLGQTGYDDERERSLIATMLGRRAEGIVVIGCTQAPPARALLAAAHVPVVQTWDLVDDPVDLIVGFSNFGAGRAVAAHLVDRGYRRLAFLGGGDPRSYARGEGFRAALHDRGMAAALEVDLASPAAIEAGRDGLARLRGVAPRIEAAFFSTDVFAAGALLGCVQAGIAVPADLAIAGFGDLELAAQMNLTTVRIRGYDIGRGAATMILARLAGTPLDRRTVDLGFELVVRGTT